MAHDLLALVRSRKLRWFASAAALIAGCAGQSGNEGELPAPPCAFRNVLAVGHIEKVGGGCVSVQIDRVVAPGEAILGTDGNELLSGDPKAGTTITGSMETVYAYQHEFKDQDAVAVIVNTRGGSLALQLFPLRSDSQVQVQWGRHQLQVDLDVLSAADCAEKLDAQREASTDLVPKSADESTNTAPPSTVTCAP